MRVLRKEIHFQQILRFVETRLGQGSKSLEIYGRVLAGQPVRAETSPLISSLNSQASYGAMRPAISSCATGSMTAFSTRSGLLQLLLTGEYVECPDLAPGIGKSSLMVKTMGTSREPGRTHSFNRPCRGAGLEQVMKLEDCGLGAFINRLAGT